MSLFYTLPGVLFSLFFLTFYFLCSTPAGLKEAPRARTCLAHALGRDTRSYCTKHNFHIMNAIWFLLKLKTKSTTTVLSNRAVATRHASFDHARPLFFFFYFSAFVAFFPSFSGRIHHVRAQICSKAAHWWRRRFLPPFLREVPIASRKPVFVVISPFFVK